MIAWLAGGFGILALLLSAIGVYGVMSLSHVAQTAGVRRADRRRRRACIRVVADHAPDRAGRRRRHRRWACSWRLAGARLLTALLFNVSATDPVSTMMAVALLIGHLPCRRLLPARRAARVDPMTALREE